MWLRITELLRCPLCKGPLECVSFDKFTIPLSSEILMEAERRGHLSRNCREFVEQGLLLCHNCKLMFPITRGLPILLSYQTEIHKRFQSEFGTKLVDLIRNYEFPAEDPAIGELLVMRSFSKEWAEYQYDGVIWELNYDDQEKRLLREMGDRTPGGGRFLEVGCGLGITTELAEKNYKMDGIGMDLSVAVLKATQHFRTNPFLHFVQASVFRMPFATNTFDVIYSRGVLHHTFSTREAFRAISSHCRPGGCAYIWVYGRGSINETLFRRVAYALECIARPSLSESADSHASRFILGAMGLGYVGFNFVRRLGKPEIQKLTFSRGIHAARDRFTPRFAHRHENQEVVEWFKNCGFEDIEVVDWRIMPMAEQDDYRRNVGVRGKRRISAGPGDRA